VAFPPFVIAGLDPAIHVAPCIPQRAGHVAAWMPGSSPGMTAERTSHDDA
jgi:hypothetical protein